MKPRQFLVILLSALLVVGLYYLFPLSREPVKSPNEPESDVSLPEETQTAEWSFRDATQANTDVSVRRSTASETTAGGTGSLVIPGQVRIPNSQQDTIDLQISVLKLKTPLPASVRAVLQASDPDRDPAAILRDVFRGNTDRSQLRDHLLGQETIRIRTGPDGRFKLRDAPAGLYRLKSTDTGWKGTTDQIFLETPDRITPLSLDVRGVARFTGVVRSPDGTPVEEATIQFKGDSRVLTTGPDGRFTLSGVHPDRPLNFFSIHKPGYDPIEVDLPALDSGEHRRKDFRLTKGTYLRVGVRTNDGEPVRSGAVTLRYRRSDTGIDVSQLRPRVAWLDDNGEAEFEGIPPGKLQLTLTSSPYLTDPDVITLDGHEYKTTQLTGKKGQRISLRYIDNSTGETIRGIRPHVDVLTSEGRRLNNGVEFFGSHKNNTIRARIHPEGDRLTIYSAPNNPNRYAPRVTGHHPSSGETISIVMKRSGENHRGSDMKTYRLTLKTSGGIPGFDWANVSDGHFSILDVETGQKYMTGPFDRGFLKWPLHLPDGPMFLYGAFNHRSSTYVFQQILQSGSESEQYVKLIPRTPATVTGTIQPQEGINPGSFTVGLALSGPLKTPVLRADRLATFVPPSLQTTLDASGKFSLKVPPGEALTVVLGSASQGTLKTGVRVLYDEKIAGLAAGRTRSLSTIQLEN